MEYIHNNYQQKIVLQELADQVNLSKYHFCRFFKSLTGKTPIDYLNFYLINQASKMLREEKYPV